MNILKVLTPNRIVGNLGERAAANFLRRNGYKILERNYIANGAEIDIIARRENITAFIAIPLNTMPGDGQILLAEGSLPFGMEYPNSKLVILTEGHQQHCRREGVQLPLCQRPLRSS